MYTHLWMNPSVYIITRSECLLLEITHKRWPMNSGNGIKEQFSIIQTAENKGVTIFLIPCSRLLLQMLTGSHPVKKFPTFYGTRRFLTMFTKSATCPCPEPNQSSPCPPSHFMKIHLNIICPSTLGSSKWCLLDVTKFIKNLLHWNIICFGIILTHSVPRSRGFVTHQRCPSHGSVSR